MSRDPSLNEAATNRSGVVAGEPMVVAAATMIDQIVPLPQVDKAVIVCHGMGQQVQFETLNTVALMLEKAAAENGRPLREAPTVRLVKIGAEVFSRAELTLDDAQGQPHTVHLYEAYWAPITEGRVTIMDTMRFLLRAGRQGWSYARQGTFTRFLFGRQTTLGVFPGTVGYIAAVYVAVISLVFYYCAFYAALGSVVVSSLLPLTIHPFVFWLQLSAVAGAPLFAAAGLLGWKLTGARRRAGRPTMKDPLLKETVLILCLGLAPFLLAAIVLSVGLWWQLSSRDPFFSYTPGRQRPFTLLLTLVITLLSFGFWGFMFWAIGRVRETVVQYVGDVAAYIAPFTVSKFADIRSAIQAVGLRVSCAVYRARRQPPAAPRGRGKPVPPVDDFLYREVIMVGHSLGSVLAYDTLNAMINEDLIPRADLRVVERTSLLLTFGSPLDKTAFIFRTQIKDQADVREALAAAVQPLISSYAHRPRSWINVFSPADIISGALQYYDAPLAAAPAGTGSKRVWNVSDPAADLPLLAHNQYWQNPTVRNLLYEAACAPPAGSASPSPAAAAPPSSGALPG